jgi:hypothetical protein
MLICARFVFGARWTRKSSSRSIESWRYRAGMLAGIYRLLEL